MLLVSPYIFQNRSIRLDGNIKTRGVHKVISRHFFPSYKYSVLKKKTPNVGGLSYRNACRRGKLIDRQMSRYCSNSQKIPARACHETRHIINYFLSEQYTAVAAQFPVANAAYRLGTCIDVVVTDKAGNTILVEIKRGCQHRHLSTGGNMLNYKNNSISDALHHQHQLQIILGKQLFMKTLPQNKNVSCLILYVDDIGVTAFREDDFSVGWCSEIHQKLLNTTSVLACRRRKSTHKKKICRRPRAVVAAAAKRQDVSPLLPRPHKKIRIF